MSKGITITGGSCLFHQREEMTHRNWLYKAFHRLHKLPGNKLSKGGDEECVNEVRVWRINVSVVEVMCERGEAGREFQNLPQVLVTMY